MPEPEEPGRPAGGAASTTEGAVSPLTGERIGVYWLEGRLGSGGMGEVFLARDERLGRRVAVKRIRHDSHPATRERFRREARAAARLNHPSIVQIYDVVEDEASGDAIVMEHAQGRTLRETLRSGLPAPALAVRLAREIAEGLAAAHAAGLIHRDLKAENVVVTPEGHAKILDFGLAKSFAGETATGEDSLTAHGAVLGTFYTMSPEQANGEEVDARSDLFSLGVLLYEMLAGRSPFRGNSAADTLRKVLVYEPPWLGALRPDLPPELPELVGRLLAKDREARPRSAREVGAALARIATSPGLAEGSEASAGESGLLTEAAAPAPRRRAAGRRWIWGLAILALLGALAFGAFTSMGRTGSAPLRVLVLQPEVKPAADETLGLAASGVLASSLSTLAAFEGMRPLDPGQAGEGTVSPAAAARSAAADEALAATVQNLGPAGATVSLRRIRESDGSVLWAESFIVPTDVKDLRLLADAVAVHLRRAWPDRRVRAGTPALEVRDQDYAELLRLKRRLEEGRATPGAEDQAALDRIVHGSPRFLEARLLAVLTALNLFSSNRDPDQLERGRESARVARELAPGDPRTVVSQLWITLAAGQTREARRLLTDLESLSPGDPENRALAGRVAEAEGNLPQAIADLEAAVERSPSWANLYRLADLEMRAGRTAAARRRLEQLLERSPGNLWALGKLGSLELLVGDPARAERIYLDLMQRQPHRSHATNLGLARALLGRQEEAVAAYRQALALSPGHVAVLLNLADAELALGRKDEARSHYSEALARLEQTEPATGLSPQDRMIQAQCLAHLGRAGEAVEQTQGVLRQSGDDPDILCQASLVYALVGDRASALVNARIALDKGVQPRWFTLPAFGSFRADPELRILLRRPARPR